MRKNKLKLIIPVLLLALVFSLNAMARDEASIAASSNNIGNAGKVAVSDGGNGVLRNSVAIVTMQLVSNSTTEADRDKMAILNNPSTVVNECGVSTVNKYLYNYPEVLLSTNITRRSCLISLDKVKKTDGDSNYYFVDGDGNISSLPFIRHYSVKRNSGSHSSYTPNVISGSIKSNSALLAKFNNKTLTTSDVKTLLAGNQTKLNTSVQAFVDLFQDTGDVGPCLNSMFKDTNEQVDNQLAYLDYLLVVNSITSDDGNDGTNWAIIDNYLKTHNDNGSKQFSIVVLGAGQHFGESGTKKTVYTFPTYYAVATGEPVSKYTGILGLNATKISAVNQTNAIVKYSGNEKAWIAKVYENMNAVSKGNAASGRASMWGGNRDLQWYTSDQFSYSGFENFKTAFMFMPTDVKGNQTGCTGYTYFSTANAPSEPPVVVEPTAGFTLATTTKFTDLLTSPDVLYATNTISMKQSKTTIDIFKGWYESARLEGLTKATMTVKMTMSPVKGNGSSAKIMDTASGVTTGSTLSGGNTLTMPNLNFVTLNQYLTGTRVIKMNDTGINVAEDTVNKYTATVTLSFPGDTDGSLGEIQFKARGKTIESTYVASDKVEWLMKSANTFYSTPSIPYAEIKEGAPGSEVFEAMAGVPTTENLYIGFGATEFMTNMKVKPDTSSGSRTYNLSYTCTNYIGTNPKCHVYCTGHSVSTSEKKWIDTTYKNPPLNTIVAVAGHWDYFSETHTLKYGETYTSTTGQTYSGTSLCPDNKGGCTWHDGGHGCACSHEVNQAHPITVTYTGTVTQPIQSFPYLNITDLELWQLSKLELIGNGDLFSNPNQTLAMNTGYNMFYNQDGYAAGNGRLIFSWNFSDGDKYGNTSVSTSDGTQMLATQCDAKATAWMNSKLAGATVKATVVSDYGVLATTEGYQSLSYYTYDSDSVGINASFSTGSTSKSATASPITFSTQPTWDTLWTNNPTSSAKWLSTDITQSGYNGVYNAPTTKYENTNNVLATSPASGLGNHPNATIKAGPGAFFTGQANKAMLRTGLNIIDSTNTATKAWDASDSITSIKNGEWETGNAYAEATKVIEYGDPGGYDYATEADGKTWRKEAIYCDDKEKVNNIVVHNPVSAQFATVIPNDSKFDQRTTASLEAGGDPTDGTVEEITLGNGQVVTTNNLFINLDRSFQIYFPDTGDFAEDPSLWGILDTTQTRGKGFTNGMDTSKWVRDKSVVFQIDVLDANNKSWRAGTEIPLDTLPDVNGVYTFYCVLGNFESANSRVNFAAIATNAPEVEFFNDNSEVTNKERDDVTYEAYTTAKKDQYLDVVGSIGSLTINDTGDFRFANLFKQPDGSGEYLIPNLVLKVNPKLPNKIASDTIDARGEVATAATNWHATYGATVAATGGKAFEYIKLPLTPFDNNIPSLRNQPLRPGYNMYMDVETVGSYYGENRNPYTYALQDSNLYYKMQITPRYWRLDLKTGIYTPVDVYMGQEGDYTPVVFFDDGGAYASEYFMYLDWQKESARRNYTALEQSTSNFALEMLTAGNTPASRMPVNSNGPDVIGTAARLFLNDLDRTFIGSEFTYGVDKNPEGLFSNWLFRMQSQRWHFTLGLPSSSVFVEAGKPCTMENIQALESGSSIIICAIDIKVKGNTWTLEYNGSGVNNSDGGGFRVIDGGQIYPPPIDPETGLPLADPIVATYSGKFTSADDLRTEGSH